MLKGWFHASATQVSLLRLVVTPPLLASVLVGLAHDHGNPSGWGDRGPSVIVFGKRAGG
jgi:hypothetical protein